MHPLRRPSALVAFGLVLTLAGAACQPLAERTAAPLSPTARPSLVVVPAEGTATSLDIGNWNIEWFGDAANGPTNETLQQSNVRDVIAGTDVDIWGLEEVVSGTAWSNLKAGLPGYAGVLSNDASVTNGSAYYTSTEQKVAVLYKTSVATLLGAKIILTANDYDFAGRPPLEVTLRATVGGATEDLVVIVLHNKAFNDETSRLRRQNAAAALKSYLDTTYPTQKVMVIGDWNDDVDVSITPGAPTPFANFVNDPARYTFPTKALSDAGIASTTGYPDFIDHQLATNEQMTDYIAGSAHVVRADQYIASYSTTTTDHYPVVSRWTIPGGAPGTPSVTVTAPNGGETWTTGSAQTIRWTSANVATVALDYTLDDGASWTAITSSTSASAGSYAWTVPATTSTAARVRVRDVASTATDQSDATFTITATAPSPAKVIINEIMANEPGSNTAGEYVELVNVGGTAASIGGWTISDKTAVRHTFASGATLAAGKAIVVFAGASGIPAGTPNAITSSTGSLNLANNGDQVIVKNGATVIDSFTYTSALSGTDGVSMNRNPDATAGATFVLHTAFGRNSSPGVRATGASY